MVIICTLPHARRKYSVQRTQQCIVVVPVVSMAVEVMLGHSQLVIMGRVSIISPEEL